MVRPCNRRSTFALVYLRTGNPLLAMALHVLLNKPAPPLEDPLPGPGAIG